MNRKLVWGGLIAVVLVFLIAVVAAPVFAVQGLIDAAKAGDEAALSRKVDFPAFRESVKIELNAELLTRMRADRHAHDNALASLGLMLAPSLVSGMVDAFVTPHAVAEMVRTAKAPDPSDAVSPPEETEPATEANRERGVRRSYGYRGLNIFAVTLTDPDRPDDHLALLMARRGLFSWKLAGLDLQPGDDA